MFRKKGSEKDLKWDSLKYYVINWRITGEFHLPDRKDNLFSRVNNVAGGMTGYNAAGFGSECSMCVLSWAGKAGRKEAEIFQNVK